jgi:hypothetical protein
MKVRTTKKRIKALKGKFNVGVKYVGMTIVVDQPNIHKDGIAVTIGDNDVVYLPWKAIGGVVGLTEDEVD